MEYAITLTIVLVLLASQVFTVGVVVHVLRRGTPSIKHELQRQEDFRVRQMAEPADLPPLLQPSSNRFWTFILVSIGIWPFALTAWLLAGLFGLVLVAVLAVLLAMTIHHELATFRWKVEKMRAEAALGKTQGREDRARSGG
jgi:hypothetical protein